jgi:hypothetical protein
MDESSGSGSGSGGSLDPTEDPAAEALLREVAALPAPDRAGELVGATVGRYRILSMLGRGGMGIVYCASPGVRRKSDGSPLTRRAPPVDLLDERRARRRRRSAPVRTRGRRASCPNPSRSTMALF